MSRNRFSIFILLSVLLHILLLLILASNLIRFATKPTEANTEPVTLTLIETPDQKPPPPVAPAKPQQANIFVPTLPEQEAAKANPNTPLESERNTALRSQNPARDPNSPMPDMTGDPRNGLSFLNNPGSQGQGQQPPQQATPQQQQRTAQQTQPTPQQKQQPQPEQAQTPPQPAPLKPPQPPPPRSDDQVPILPPLPKPSQQQVVQNTTPQQQTRATPQQAPRPPPAAFSMTRTEIHGGSADNTQGIPSPEARDTELGRYKQKMYRAIGSRWMLSADSNMTVLGIGSVRIRFYVRANGVIENVRVVEDSGSGNNSTAILQNISIDAIVRSAPFEPFSETMKQQLGSGYDEEFTFSIY